MRLRIISAVVLCAAAASAWAAGPAGARTLLHRCPAVRFAHGHAVVPLQVASISCREGGRLVTAWRTELGRDSSRCVPSNDGVKHCVLDRWRFSCPQTRNGWYWAVTAQPLHGRARLAFHYGV